ncbi:hypothetical protein [Flavobacterium sp. LS1R10]|jgi:hypothetical protein|uniref:hypothetical protein n=1 Tax=Flavobacterium sp. LS1R10 TaxID=2497482 RepID=UPI000F82DCB6|nr:hypothetical protein [Flavobacterium sp. LS1R10]RTY76218.1 hypothetical protein EKL96_01630 [Flavobacterium sp. LS1R10]
MTTTLTISEISTHDGVKMLYQNPEPLFSSNLEDDDEYSNFMSSLQIADVKNAFKFNIRYTDGEYIRKLEIKGYNLSEMVNMILHDENNEIIVNESLLRIASDKILLEVRKLIDLPEVLTDNSFTIKHSSISTAYFEWLEFLKWSENH